MSRSAHSKTRPEKSRTPSSPTPHAAAIAPPPDIVPGRLTELDWATMVAKEEGEEVVYAVIEELMSRVMEESLHLYVKKELIPYTVSKVYERMLQVVQWRFMEPDKGEEVVDNPTWQEDEEPKPCRIDSWASGAVPVVYSHQKQCLQVTPTLIDEEKAAPSPEVSKSQEHHKETAIKVAEGQPQKTEQVLEKSEHTTTRKKSKQLQKPTPPTEEKKAKREYQHLRGPLRSSNLRHGTTPLADLEKEPPVKQTIESLPTEKEPPALLPSSFYNMLKIQAGRPPQRSSALTFDDSGNVTSVRKLDITKLPRHEVEVLWEVVEPTMKAKHSCNETLHSVNSKLKIQTVADSTLKKEKQKGKLEPKKQVFLSTLLDPSDGMLPGPLPTAGRVLWDSMELSPGVTVADPLGKKRASFREPSWLHSRDIMDEETLRPIQATVQRPTATTEQMITGKAAMVRGNPVKPFKDEKAELFLNFSTSPVQLSSKLRKICDEQSQLFTEISEITLSKAAFATIEVRPKIPQKPIPPTEEKKTNKEYQYPRWAHRLPILHRITKPQAESMEKCLVLPLSASKTSPKLLPTSFQTLPKILARQPLLSNKAATFHEFDHVSPLQILDAAKMTMNPVDMTLKVVDPSTGEVCLRAKPSNARNYQRSISLKQSTRELETFNLGDRLPSTIDDFYLPPFHCKNQTLSRSQGPKHHIFSCGDHHTSQEIYSAQHGLVSVNDTMIWDSMELSSKIIDRDSGGNRHFSLKEVPQHLHRYNLNSEAARSIKIPSANDKDIFVSLFSNINKPQDQVKSKLRKLNDAHPWQVEQYSEVNLNKTEIIPGGTKAKYLQKPSPPAQEKKNNREYQRHRVHFRSGSLQCNTTSSADPELTFLPKRAFGTLPEIKKNPKYLRTSKYNTFENKAESWPKFNRFRPFNEFANISSLQGTEPGKIHRQLMELTWEIVDPSVGEVHLRLKSVSSRHKRSASKIKSTVKSGTIILKKGIPPATEICLPNLNSKRQMMKKQQSCKQMKSHIGSMKPPESTYSAKKSTLTINNHKVLDNKNTSESEVIPDSRGIQSPPLKQPAWELNKDSLEEDQAEEEQIEQKIPVLDEKNESPLKESSQQQELCEESKINKAFPQLQLTGLPHHETDPRLHSEHLELETVTVKNPKTSSLQVERDRTLHISDQNVLGVLSAFTDNYIPGFGEEIPNRNLGYQRQTSVNGVTKCPVQPCRSRMDPLFTAPRMLLYSTDLSPVVTLRDSRGTRHTSWTEPENQDSKNSLIKALIPVQARVCGRLTHGNKYIN